MTEKGVRQLELLTAVSGDKKRDLSMPGNPRYQPEELKPYFGYDQWVLWLALVEIRWMTFLDKMRFADIGNKLNDDVVLRLFKKLKTRDQDIIEKRPEVGHDINALIAMMKVRGRLSRLIHKFIHYGLTSYDTIETARALMFKMAFDNIFKSILIDVDFIWRQKIRESAEIIQIGRTHLQDALPITVGFWLSVIHDRFHNNTIKAAIAAKELTGKISGACGTSASFIETGIEEICFERLGSDLFLDHRFLVEELDLAVPSLSTQIAQPEILARFLFELTMLSGSLAQLGDDSRILQSSSIGEISSVSSTSSTMAHKDSNPIAAENLTGMYSTVVGEFTKVLLNQQSNLGRDLRNSSPARDYPAVAVYVFQQLKTMKRLLNNMTVNAKRCQENFGKNKYYVMGELLYLALSVAGMDGAHNFVNKVVVPEAKKYKANLVLIMDRLSSQDPKVKNVWKNIPSEMKQTMLHPENYIGNAIYIAATQESNYLSL